MYLDKNTKNRYTVGKELRKNKQLRKKDSKAKVLPLTPALQAYREDLQANGLIVGPLEVGLFETRNGLKYPGFIAKQKIVSSSVLLRVPVDCLLTTRDAFLSQIQKVFIENPKFYSKTFSSDWEDRIILTYLLYQYQKGKKSKWFHLLQNLPRDIDYVAFWPEKQLDYLEDDWVKHSIGKQRKRVLREQGELISIAKKYPQFFDIKIFSPENITWIHVHLVTRCFGKYFEYTTMVPYAELFNHQCVDVYYTMAYDKDNPNDPHEYLAQPRELTPREEEEADTSQGSYDASDVSCQDQDFFEKQLPDFKVQCTKSIASEYRTLHSYLVAFINFNDEVSLPYLEKIYTEMENAMSCNEKLAMQRLAKVHSTNVRYLKLVKEFFYKLGSNKYSYGLKQRKKWKVQAKNQEEEKIDPNCNYFEGKWQKDKFDQFLMVCGSKDQFQQGSQVYFCYGRLPNRLLLVRYGIALEHNKYNHMFIRISIEDYVYKSPALQRAVQEEIALKKYRRFKIKRTVFCCELLAYYRCLLWNYNQDPEYIFYVYDLDRQQQVLRKVKDTLQEKLDTFTCPPQKNQQLLQDKSIGYHEYFAIVYRLQQQRILQQQLKMIDYAQKLIHAMKQDEALETLLRQQKEQSKLRMQIMMEVYLRSFRYF